MRKPTAFRTAARTWLPLLALFGLPHAASAQRGGRGLVRDYIRDPGELAMVQKMEDALVPGFKDDVFTLARLMYQPSGYGRGRNWQDDFPDADVNLGWRLFQVTSLKVHPGFKYISINPKELAGYPFTYLTATDSLNLTPDESAALRKYLLNGGFLMAEDFWGDRSWAHVYQEMRKIFPDRAPVEIGLSHPIFHNVFDFKYLAQMPSVGVWTGYGQAYDPADYSKDHDPHYYAVYDDKNRMMVLICRNNHFGDGWEHEGDDHSYFDHFSEPQAYPMFINILFYAMTH